jgi:hypothetical protein
MADAAQFATSGIRPAPIVLKSAILSGSSNVMEKHIPFFKWEAVAPAAKRRDVRTQYANVFLAVCSDSPTVLIDAHAPVR